MIDQLTELQASMLKAAGKRRGEPVYCNLLSENSWSFKAGGQIIDGGPEVDEAFRGLVSEGYLAFQDPCYVLTPEGRHLAGNLLQGDE